MSKCETDLGSIQQCPTFVRVFIGDARALGKLIPRDCGVQYDRIDNKSVDLIVTSPPYWRKRDYQIAGQIGKESSSEEYVKQIMIALRDWKRVLRPSGSIFLNIGDTYWRKSLQGIPGRIEAAAREEKFIIRNRIVWKKRGGSPDPVRDRLAMRHEYIIHLALNGYYYDLFGYAKEYSQGKRGANPGDVWEISPKRDMGNHLAPFPKEIAERAIMLACPERVCTKCNEPQRRRVVRSIAELDPERPQARRALALVKQHRLTDEHIRAIQATGISDAGKARSIQTGTDKNSTRVKELARHAKSVLKGYFREFTFTKLVDDGWTNCGCNAPFAPGVVLDPFMGTGTTLEVAQGMNRSAIGVDLDPSQVRGTTK